MTCRHERQEWRGRELPCADPECTPMASLEGAGQVLEWRGPGQHDVFDRALFDTQTQIEAAGRLCAPAAPRKSWVWLRRGSPYNPRKC